MTWRRVVLAVVLTVAVSIGGLWLWGKPRSSHVMPTAQTSPVDVVMTYVRALNDRDFAASVRMGADSRGDISADWFTVHAPNMTNVTIDHVDAVMPGPRAATYLSNSELAGWEQTVHVDTTVTLNNFEGFHGPETDQPWSYELVRHNNSKPWRIFDQGEG
ncbi:hypothetical protein V3G39_10340 [Dermatophilaceae bacterium Sec6.4]|nr:hypothetical protein [Actinomycetota bacterium]